MNGQDRPLSLKARLGIAAVAAAINGAMYLVPNHFPLGEVRSLPWSALDAWVPFLPATVWVYFSDYLLVISAFLLCATFGDARRFVRAYFSMLFIGGVVHLLWPTTFPRELYPLVGESVTLSAFRYLREVDQPTSCMPSMHVAGSYLGALSLWRHPRWQLGLWLSWATAIALSTLTAKQHYVVDVAAGLLVALVFWGAFYLLPFALERRRPALGPT